METKTIINIHIRLIDEAIISVALLAKFNPLQIYVELNLSKKEAKYISTFFFFGANIFLHVKKSIQLVSMVMSVMIKQFRSNSLNSNITTINLQSSFIPVFNLDLI